MRRILALIALLSLAATALADQGNQRQAFLDAEAALKRGDRATSQRLAARLDGYPLLPYLTYADINRRLAQRPVAEINRFLEEEEGSILADRLRAAWQMRLAGSGDWSTWLEFDRPGGGATGECRRRQALLATGSRSAALAGIEGLWLTGSSLPDACDPVLAAWRTEGIPADLIFDRLRLALEANRPGLAGYLARLLPEADRQLATSWVALHRNPERIRNAKLSPSSHARAPELLRHVWLRYVRGDPEAAAGEWDARRESLALAEEYSLAIEREIALRLALRRLPEAGARMAQLPPQAFDSTLRQWQARHAITGRNWGLLIEAITAMEPEERSTNTWRYWEARGLEATGKEEEAFAIYSVLARERDFYGFLAADRVDLPYRIGHRPTTADVDSMAAVANHPAVRRAVELYALGRIVDARREWGHALRSLEGHDLEMAGLIADGLGWRDRAIVSVAQARAWDDIDLRFPLDHDTIVVRESERHGINPAWAFAVIRQESAFMADARSAAGAVGLMQIMPATARTIAPRAQVKMNGTRTLLSPAHNIRLGTWYLRRNLDRFSGNPVLASAAYNAGGDRVRSWLPEEGEVEADIWIETIPFNETRDYVKKVLTYKLIYEVRLGLPPTRVSSNMVPIAARDGLERARRAHLDSLPPMLAQAIRICDAPGYDEVPCS